MGDCSHDDVSDPKMQPSTRHRERLAIRRQRAKKGNEMIQAPLESKVCTDHSHDDVSNPNRQYEHHPRGNFALIVVMMMSATQTGNLMMKKPIHPSYAYNTLLVHFDYT